MNQVDILNEQRRAKNALLILNKNICRTAKKN